MHGYISDINYLGEMRLLARESQRDLTDRFIGEHRMTRPMRIALTATIAAWILTCAAVSREAASRIQDLANVEGVRQNQLIGYGLVVRLNGTGYPINKWAFTSQHP